MKKKELLEKELKIKDEGWDLISNARWKITDLTRKTRWEIRDLTRNPRWEISDLTK